MTDTSKSTSKREDEIETKISNRTRLTIQIVGAAIFGALSYVISAIITANPVLVPRIPGWFIAIVDPISIIWITCYLIFGVESGILCSFIGFLGLIPFDPSGGVGPVMKLVATLSLMCTQILLLRLYKKNTETRSSQKLKEPKNFIISGVIGAVLRVIMMLILNIIVFLTIYAAQVAFVNLEFIGLSAVTGWTAIVVGVIIINLFTSIWDLLIPYAIVFGALGYGLKLDEKFEIW